MTTNVRMRRTENNIHWVYWLLWAALLTCVCAAVAMGDDRRRSDRPSRDAEMEFIQRLSDSEYAAVKLAQAGGDKSRRREMREYLDSVERTSQARIGRLGVMMDRWYRRRVEPALDPKYETRVGVLRNRDVRGDEFEIRMLKSMIEQRQEENAMIARYLPLLDHDDVREIAKTVYDKNSDQARRLQSWLKSWYDISYTTPDEPRALPPGAYAPRTY